MLLYQTREYILSGKAIYEYCLFASPYYFTPLSENREQNAMGIPRGNLTRFMTTCKLNNNPFKHLKRLWLYLSAKLIKLGSEKYYFPDILKIGTDKGTWHQKRKKKKKKSNKSKTKRTKIHTGRGPIIAICFLFLSAYFYVVQYTPSSALFIILNFTNRLTLDGNINNLYAHARIREPL
jgi:hypothetical protein